MVKKVIQRYEVGGVGGVEEGLISSESGLVAQYQEEIGKIVSQGKARTIDLSMAIHSLKNRHMKGNSRVSILLTKKKKDKEGKEVEVEELTKINFQELIKLLWEQSSDRDESKYSLVKNLIKKTDKKSLTYLQGYIYSDPELPESNALLELQKYIGEEKVIGEQFLSHLVERLSPEGLEQVSSTLKSNLEVRLQTLSGHVEERRNQETQHNQLVGMQALEGELTTTMNAQEIKELLGNGMQYIKGMDKNANGLDEKEVFEGLSQLNQEAIGAIKILISSSVEIGFFSEVKSSGELKLVEDFCSIIVKERKKLSESLTKKSESKKNTPWLIPKPTHQLLGNTQSMRFQVIQQLIGVDTTTLSPLLGTPLGNAWNAYDLQSRQEIHRDFDRGPNCIESLGHMDYRIKEFKAKYANVSWEEKLAGYHEYCESAQITRPEIVDQNEHDRILWKAINETMNGEPTIFALQRWAGENIAFSKDLRDIYRKAVVHRSEFLRGQGTARPLQDDLITMHLHQQVDDLDKTLQMMDWVLGYTPSTEGSGFGTGLKTTDWTLAVPFAGSLLRSQNTERKEALIKRRGTKTNYPVPMNARQYRSDSMLHYEIQQEILDEYIKSNPTIALGGELLLQSSGVLKSIQSKDWSNMTKIAQGAPSMIGFIGELALMPGMGQMNAATRGRNVLQGLRTAGWYTTINQPKLQADIRERAAHKLGMKVDENGNLKLDIQNGEGINEAVAKAVLSNLTEYFSEQLGEAVIGPVLRSVTSRLIPEVPGGRITGERATGMQQSILNYMNRIGLGPEELLESPFNSVHWDGIVTEYLEEFVGNRMQNVLTGDRGHNSPFFWDGDEELVILGSVLMMQGAMTTARVGVMNPVNKLKPVEINFEYGGGKEGSVSFDSRFFRAYKEWLINTEGVTTEDAQEYLEMAEHGPETAAEAAVALALVNNKDIQAQRKSRAQEKERRGKNKATEPLQTDEPQGDTEFDESLIVPGMEDRTLEGLPAGYSRERVKQNMEVKEYGEGFKSTARELLDHLGVRIESDLKNATKEEIEADIGKKYESIYRVLRHAHTNWSKRQDNEYIQAAWDAGVKIKKMDPTEVVTEFRYIIEALTKLGLLKYQGLEGEDPMEIQVARLAMKSGLCADTSVETNSKNPNDLINGIVNMYENEGELSSDDIFAIEQILKKGDPEVIRVVMKHPGLARMMHQLSAEGNHDMMVQSYIQNITVLPVESSIVLTHRFVQFILRSEKLYTTELANRKHVGNVLGSITPGSKRFIELLRKFKQSLQNTYPALTVGERGLLSEESNSRYESGSFFDLLQLVATQEYSHLGNPNILEGLILSLQGLYTLSGQSDHDIKISSGKYDEIYSVMFDEIPVSAYTAQGVSIIHTIESKLGVTLPEAQRSAGLDFIKEIQSMMLDGKSLSFVFAEVWKFAKQYGTQTGSMELGTSIAFKILEEVSIHSLAFLSQQKNKSQELIDLIYFFMDFQYSVSEGVITEDSVTGFERVLELMIGPNKNSTLIVEFKYRIACKVSGKEFDSSVINGDTLPRNELFDASDIENFNIMGLFATHSSFLDYRYQLLVADGANLGAGIHILIKDILKKGTYTLDEISKNPKEILFPTGSSEIHILLMYLNTYGISDSDIGNMFGNFVELIDYGKETIYAREKVEISFTGLSKKGQGILQQSMLGGLGTILGKFEDPKQTVSAEELSYILLILQNNGLAKDFKFVLNHLNEYEQIAYPLFTVFINNSGFFSSVYEGTKNNIQQEEINETNKRKIYDFLTNAIFESNGGVYLKKIQVPYEDLTLLSNYLQSAFDAPEKHTEFFTYLASTGYKERLNWMALIYGSNMYQAQVYSDYAMRVYSGDRSHLISVEKSLGIVPGELTKYGLDSHPVPYKAEDMENLIDDIEITDLKIQSDIESIILGSKSTIEGIKQGFSKIGVDGNYLISNPRYLVYINKKINQTSFTLTEIFPQLVEYIKAIEPKILLSYFESAGISEESIVQNTDILGLFRELLPQNYHIISMYPDLVHTIQERSVSLQYMQLLISTIFDTTDSDTINSHLSTFQNIHNFEAGKTYSISIHGTEREFRVTTGNINSIKGRILHMYLERSHPDQRTRSRIIRQIMEFGICGKKMEIDMSREGRGKNIHSRIDNAITLNDGHPNKESIRRMLEDVFSVNKQKRSRIKDEINEIGLTDQEKIGILYKLARQYIKNPSQVKNTDHKDAEIVEMGDPLIEEYHRHITELQTVIFTLFYNGRKERFISRKSWNELKKEADRISNQNKFDTSEEASKVSFSTGEYEVFALTTKQSFIKESKAFDEDHCLGGIDGGYGDNEQFKKYKRDFLRGRTSLYSIRHTGGTNVATLIIDTYTGELKELDMGRKWESYDESQKTMRLDGIMATINFLYKNGKVTSLENIGTIIYESGFKSHFALNQSNQIILYRDFIKQVVAGTLTQEDINIWNTHRVLSDNHEDVPSDITQSQLEKLIQLQGIELVMDDVPISLKENLKEVNSSLTDYSNNPNYKNLKIIHGSLNLKGFKVRLNDDQRVTFRLPNLEYVGGTFASDHIHISLPVLESCGGLKLYRNGSLEIPKLMYLGEDIDIQFLEGIESYILLKNEDVQPFRFFSYGSSSSPKVNYRQVRFLGETYPGFTNKLRLQRLSIEYTVFGQKEFTTVDASKKVCIPKILEKIQECISQVPRKTLKSTQYADVVYMNMDIEESVLGMQLRYDHAKSFLKLDSLTPDQKIAIQEAHDTEDNVRTIRRLQRDGTFTLDQATILVELGICGRLRGTNTETTLRGKSHTVNIKENGSKINSAKVQELFSLAGMNKEFFDTIPEGNPILSIEEHPQSYSITYKGPGKFGSNLVKVHVYKDGEKIHLDTINTTYSPKWFSGAQILNNIVEYGISKGYKTVGMTCAGLPEIEGKIGYFVWPIMGVEEIPSQKSRIAGRIRDNLEKIRNETHKENIIELLERYDSGNVPGSMIQGLYSIEGGREFRKQYGGYFEGEIILDSQHSSYQSFKRYIRERNER